MPCWAVNSLKLVLTVLPGLGKTKICCKAGKTVQFQLETVSQIFRLHKFKETFILNFALHVEITHKCDDIIYVLKAIQHVFSLTSILWMVFNWMSKVRENDCISFCLCGFTAHSNLDPSWFNSTKSHICEEKSIKKHYVWIKVKSSHYF